jgi:hypothetical protein
LRESLPVLIASLGSWYFSACERGDSGKRRGEQLMELSDTGLEEKPTMRFGLHAMSWHAEAIVLCLLLQWVKV